MFDIFDLITLTDLVNNIIIGIAAAMLFLVAFHITSQNWDIDVKGRDLFFMLAGPTVGAVGTILGLPQSEIIMYTFTLNGGLTGAKEGLQKYFSMKSNGKAKKIAELEAALKELTKDG